MMEAPSRPAEPPAVRVPVRASAVQGEPIAARLTGAGAGRQQATRLEELVHAGNVAAINELLRDLNAAAAAEAQATREAYAAKRKPVAAAMFMAMANK
jgi:hypothetical protein